MQALVVAIVYIKTGAMPFRPVVAAASFLLVALLLAGCGGAASSKMIGKDDAITASATCRRAPRAIRVDAISSSRHFTLQSDSDGITRTPGRNCRSPHSGEFCDLCCNGACCENFSGADASPIPTQHRIGLRFAVVSLTDETYRSLTSQTTEGGNYSSRVVQNVVTLNRVFGPILNIWFYVDSVISYIDPRMVASLNTDACYTSAACEFYSYTMPRIKGDSSRSITIVVADRIVYLGEAQFPWESVEDSPTQYIEVHAKTIGVRGPGWPTGLGHTLVHEMGHYFGLWHVFERPGRCDQYGDWVDDTPASLYAATRSQACNAVVDSCPAWPGNDAIDNYMNYARDECQKQFTPGQIARMRQGFRKYRPLLFRYSEARDGLFCAANDTSLSQCAASNAARLNSSDFYIHGSSIMLGSAPKSSGSSSSGGAVDIATDPVESGGGGGGGTTHVLVLASVLSVATVVGALSAGAALLRHTRRARGIGYSAANHESPDEVDAPPDAAPQPLTERAPSLTSAPLPKADLDGDDGVPDTLALTNS